MLFKLMKHDFRYSAKLFFALGAIVIALAFIIGAAENIQHAARQQMVMQYPVVGDVSFAPFGFASSFFILSNIILLPVGIAAIIHIAQFYRKSMFGKVGHLAMTVPVSRGALLMSKIAVSFVWFLYVIGVVAVMAIIINLLSPFRNFESAAYAANWVFSSIFNAEIIAFGINLAVTALGAIALLFFCVTLAHSAIAGRRIHGIVAGVIGFAYAWLYLWAANALVGRFMQTVEWTLYGGGYWTSLEPQTGLQYGRIVIGQVPWGWFDGAPMSRDVHIDIFFIAFTLAAAAIAIFATRALLKKRVSLS